MTKSEIRARMREQRRELKRDDKLKLDEAICSRFLGMNLASPIAVYLASKDEINLDSFIGESLREGKKLFAPKWNGESYELMRLKGLKENDIDYGPMNIREPIMGETIPSSEISTWLIPGLAFSRKGERIGYGGGWYDRFLAAARTDSLKLAVAYDFQIFDSLPSEAHDMKVTIL